MRRSLIQAAKLELDDLVVLSLVSTFERTLRDDISSLARVANNGTNEVDERVRLLILDDIRYWKLTDEILPLYSDRVEKSIIGQVKQAIEYRNWVAHGRSPNTPPASNVTPFFAFKLLTDFLQTASILS
jgi:hypothetical protein